MSIADDNWLDFLMAQRKINDQAIKDYLDHFEQNLKIDLPYDAPVKLQLNSDGEVVNLIPFDSLKDVHKNIINELSIELKDSPKEWLIKALTQIITVDQSKYAKLLEEKQMATWALESERKENEKLKTKLELAHVHLKDAQKEIVQEHERKKQVAKLCLVDFDD